jgi:chromate transporter
MPEIAQLALIFLRLGATAFGGPAAHIALMKTEFVTKRAWLSEDAFLDLLGATNLIPGPNSTEIAIHIGFLRAKWAGLVVAGVCFILPAMLLVLLLAELYTRFGLLLPVQGVLYGVKPVLIAIICQAVIGLSKSALKTRTLQCLAGICFIIALFGIPELPILLLSGVVTLLIGAMHHKKEAKLSYLWALLGFVGVTLLIPVIFPQTQHLPLFWFFLKIGSVLYGSGYVLLAFLQDGLVRPEYGLTQTQLLDAIAIGQITPGPVFTAATFIGYLLGGVRSALLATLGIFLPAFLFVAISGPLIPRLRQSPQAGAFLDGINAASLALMLGATVSLGRVALFDGWTVGICLVSLLLLVRYKINSLWLLLGAGTLGVWAH